MQTKRNKNNDADDDDENNVKNNYEDDIRKGKTKFRLPDSAKWIVHAKFGFQNFKTGIAFSQEDAAYM